ncbi:MAG: Glycosyl transferase, family I [Candidatus Collierbacteria bacterium GW2011_GWA2_46_26]|uniref:Glycosyl transferase, family I n=1 Tax=Candidatus Collierbacteria bacterium GW2011_GWA2_46_26 TaxID=1618381 RepID=A0A0G1PM36_9BACT|nr:MAG: Glycosyl transferase, family I [Candidatus Collierbacteria bacterium GW2011_GWC2_44_13]KKU33806.1 MAG: Glycosyl transferase, family I [Candidatus Collierbacteria bacterium GW2011_GWA2_46_26]
MLTPYLPYPDSSGGQIRTQNLLKHLCKNHEITLVSLIKDAKENENIMHLLKYCKKVMTFQRSATPWTLKNILKTGFSFDPFLIVRNFAPGVKEAVTKELETGEYDLVHAETFYVMPSIPKTDLPIILVDQTIEYLVYQHYVNETAPWYLKPLLQIDVEKMKFSERFYWRKASQVVAVSEADKREMLKLEPELNVEIVPNGVNLDLFRKKTNWSTKEKAILLISNFKWLQNVEAAHLLINKVFPLVQDKVKGVKLWIIGQYVPKEIIEIKEKDILVKSVPEEDVQTLVDAWHDATVFASTIKGPGGTRLKNLAAMASQLPIVSTKVGVEGLMVEDKKHVLIGNTPAKIADLLVKVIKSPSLAEHLALSTRHHVEMNFDWRIIAKGLDSLYNKLGKK